MFFGSQRRWEHQGCGNVGTCPCASSILWHRCGSVAHRVRRNYGCSTLSLRNGVDAHAWVSSGGHGFLSCRSLDFNSAIYIYACRLATQAPLSTSSHPHNLYGTEVSTHLKNPATTPECDCLDQPSRDKASTPLCQGYPNLQPPKFPGQGLPTPFHPASKDIQSLQRKTPFCTLDGFLVAARVQQQGSGHPAAVKGQIARR